MSIAISDSGQTLQQIADGAPLKPLYFDQGVPAFPNLGAMLKGAAHPNAAKVYLNWLISMQGGEAIVKGTSEYSARSDVAGPTAPSGVTVPAPDAQNLVLPTDQDWLTRRDALNTKWNATFQG